MIITLTRNGRVHLQASIELPMSPRRLWAEIADLPRFATHDFFHARFELPGGRLEAGAPLRIRHSYLGVTIHRAGRVLRYQPGVGYSFSDLSTRGAARAFPHVFSYRIEPLSDAAGSMLHLDVRGRWTLRVVPRPFAKLWLWIVFLQISVAVEDELLWCCPRRARRREAAAAKHVAMMPTDGSGTLV